MDWCKKSWWPENAANLCADCLVHGPFLRGAASLGTVAIGSTRYGGGQPNWSFCGCLHGQSFLLALRSEALGDSFVILHISFEPTSVAVSHSTKRIKAHLMDTQQKPKLQPSQRLRVLERLGNHHQKEKTVPICMGGVSSPVDVSLTDQREGGACLSESPLTHSYGLSVWNAPC